MPNSPSPDTPAGEDAAGRPARGLRAALHRIEDTLLALLVCSLVLLAGGQIVLRSLFQFGYDWVEPLLRTLVLWVAMAGAAVAAREDKHLGIDAIPRLLVGLPKVAARVLAQGFAAAVCFALAWYSVGLVQLEQESAVMAFGSVPVWATQLAMPVGFALMGMRFALRAVGVEAPRR